MDFGAEKSFAKAAASVREHYGIDLPSSRLRQLTLQHAKASGAVPHEGQAPAQTLLTSMDGCMIPIAQAGSGPDRRKGRTLEWRQATLCCARAQGKVEAVYGATLGPVKMAGLLWRQVAEEAGLGARTLLHAVADGAEPIYEAFQEQFAWRQKKARFTLDFHHVSDYLSAAGEVLAPESKKEWLHRQQGRLKANQLQAVLGELEPRLEPEVQKDAPVRAAHRYMRARSGQMDYAGALAAGLPIGSGEVESGHRHVIQERLKKAGAWWAERNAQPMLQLRTLRANRDWDRYWSSFAKN